MSYEVHWDETWIRVTPGHYINARGMEITRTGSATWTLSDPLRDETRHRTLKAAKAAADEV